MDLLPALAERSFFRSRVRTNVIIVLLQLGPLHARQLHRLTGHASQHIVGALSGDGVAYSRARSLVALGLVRAFDGPEGVVFELTLAGRALALRAWAREKERLSAR